MVVSSASTKEAAPIQSAADALDESLFSQHLVSYCMDVFWNRYGGDWDATYERCSTTLGIPELDKNAWADSCPRNPGYDELANFMGYGAPVCFAALGHFTAEQAQRAHYLLSELNPVMYAWGQYYAAQAAPPPPQASPPPESFKNPCQVSHHLSV